MKSTLAAALLLATPLAAIAQTAVALDRGPNAVGIRELLLRDPSRPTLPLREGGTAPDDRGRQMQIVVWYPAAAGTGRALTRADYIAMAARSLDFAPAQHDEGLAAFTSRAAGLRGDTALLTRRLPSVLATRVAARRDARAMAGIR